MESTNVREINEAAYLQAMKGTRTVRTASGFRVIRARTVKGRLQAKVLSGTWENVKSVTIE